MRQLDSGAGGHAVRPHRGRRGTSEPAHVRVRGIAYDVALIHIASMSNLMAALGWALVDLIEHPAQLGPVAGGDGDLAQRCALESTRLAQRSIMSRAVLAPVDFDIGDVTIECPPAGPSPPCCRC